MRLGSKSTSASKCAGGAVAVVVLAGVAFGAGPVRKDLHYKVGKHSMVSLNNQYGAVRVKAGVPHQVVVTAVLHSDKVEVDESRSGNRINLVSHVLPGSDQASATLEY